jgi:RimJ/RimL family protein N-acetyltransferase
MKIPTVEDVIAAPETLRTEHLRLEKLHARHVPALIESTDRSIPELRFIHWVHRPGRPWREIAYWNRVHRAVAEGTCIWYLAFEEGTERYIGYVDLFDFVLDVPSCGIGYVGDSAALGTGMMRSAVQRVLGFAFELGVHRIQATCDARNERSIRFAERALGFRREGIKRHFERDPQGELSDEVFFSKLSTDA